MRKIFISWLAICGVLFGVWQASAQIPVPIGMFGSSRYPACTFPSLPNVLGDYRANKGVTTNSGNVTAVTDQSGAGNNLVNSGTVPFSAIGVSAPPMFRRLRSASLSEAVPSRPPFQNAGLLPDGVPSFRVKPN